MAQKTNDITCNGLSIAIDHLLDLSIYSEQASALSTRNAFNIPIIAALNGLLGTLRSEICDAVSCAFFYKKDYLLNFIFRSQLVSIRIFLVLNSSRCSISKQCLTVSNHRLPFRIKFSHCGQKEPCVNNLQKISPSRTYITTSIMRKCPPVDITPYIQIHYT